MNIEIPHEIARKALDEWKKLPKYNTFVSTQYGNTEQFHCKYPSLNKVMIMISDGIGRCRQ